MSCGCKTSGHSTHNCGTKSPNGCASVDTCGNSYKLSVFDWLSNINNPSTKSNIVEVRFKNDRKSFYRNDDHLSLHIGSIVTVESNPGHDVGVVSLTGELVKIQMKKKGFSEDDLLKVYRVANQRDVEVWQEYRNKEEAVKKEARKIANFLGLQMKITDIEYQGDGLKATFFYTAESRVDFRALIKEYATAFRTKIDMKQIGFRQEASKIGGIGSCGRELCCSTWLTDFRSVNTNSARYQQLSINPQKLAGQCGKLKCCLNFELDSYLDVLKDFPSSSTTLNTEKGKAFCIKIDVFKKKMWFTYVGNTMVWYDLEVEEVHKMIAKNKQGEPCQPLEEAKVENFNPMLSVDLIEENKVDRFEKKKPRNKKRRFSKRNHQKNNQKNNGQKNNNQKTNPKRKQIQPNENNGVKNKKTRSKRNFKKKKPQNSNKDA